MPIASHASHLDSKLYVASREHARFSCAGREYEGRIQLDDELCAQLRVLELTPEAYGATLFAAVFPPASPLREGVRLALAEAERDKLRLRFRLHLARSLDVLFHTVRWELLCDPERKEALSRVAGVSFSRYSSVAHEPGRPTSRHPRMLWVVAAPTDAARYGMAEIPQQEATREFAKAVQALAGTMEIDLLTRATPTQLRERLTSQRYHVLHILGHGLVQRDRGSSLVLENEDGTACFVSELELAEVLKSNRHLRLVTLIACHGGAPSSDDSLSGLAGRLVEEGRPAVIGMRQAVTIELGHLFACHLYRVLGQTAQVDVAVNEARQRLFLAQPQAAAWSSPVLFMRLSDGRLWESGQRPRRILLIAAWLLASMFLLASILRVDQAEVDCELAVSGLSFVLAEPRPVIKRFRLAELGATRLEEIRLPWSLAASSIPAGVPRGLFLRTVSTQPSTVTLQETPLAAGTRVAIERLAEREIRISLDGPELRMFADLAGKVGLKLLHSPLIQADFRAPEPVEFSARGRLDLDLVFSRFAGDEIHAPLAVERLGLVQIKEKSLQGADRSTQTQEISTILGGRIRVAAGPEHNLQATEFLRFTVQQGSLNSLALSDEQITVGFRGQVLQPVAMVPGGEPLDLRPTWLAVAVGSTGSRLLLALACLAAAVMLAIEIEPVRRVRTRTRNRNPLLQQPKFTYRKERI